MAKLANMPANEETSKARAEYKNSVIGQIAPIEKHLGMLFKWVSGDKLSWVDFFLHQVFTYISQIQPEVKTKCPNLMKHTEQLLENKKYKAYYSKIDWKVAFGAPLEW